MKHLRGYLILEILIGIVILGMLIAAVFPTLDFLLKRSRRSTSDSQAATLLQEALEASYHVFLVDWTAFSTLPNGEYQLAVKSDGTWDLVPGIATGIGAQFTRKITLSDVRRDANGVQTPTGTRDSESRKVSSVISWVESTGPKSITAELLLINLRAL